MLPSKFVLSGQFTAGARGALASPLDVYVDDYGISIGRQNGIRSTRLIISPFQGKMFFNQMLHKEGDELVGKEYRLAISGTNIGVYESGGGADGEFDVFDLKEAEVRGKFSESGLEVTIKAKTWPGQDICYSARERRKNAYDAIDIDVSFLVLPENLPAFLASPKLLEFGAFSRFRWHKK
jgi:hypothetical protein